MTDALNCCRLPADDDEDAHFMAKWSAGLERSLAAMLRVRQIQRALVQDAAAAPMSGHPTRSGWRLCDAVPIVLSASAIVILETEDD